MRINGRYVAFKGKKGKKSDGQERRTTQGLTHWLRALKATAKKSANARTTRGECGRREKQDAPLKYSARVIVDQPHCPLTPHLLVERCVQVLVLGCVFPISLSAVVLFAGLAGVCHQNSADMRGYVVKRGLRNTERRERRHLKFQNLGERTRQHVIVTHFPSWK